MVVPLGHGEYEDPVFSPHKNLLRTSAWKPAALASAALIAISLAGCGSSAGEAADKPETSQQVQELHDRLPDAIKDRGVLRIGTVTSTTPLTQKPGKDVEGLIPELADEIAGILGVEVEFIESPMSAQITALQADKVDLTWSAMTDTAEREASVNMVPYLKTTSSPIVLEGNPSNIQKSEDLCGRSVGIVRGGNSHVALETFQETVCKGGGLEPMEVKLYDKSTDGLLQLQSANIEAFVGIGIQLKHNAETANNGTTFDFVDVPIDESVMTICTHKDEAELADIVRAALVEMADSGKYNEVLERYSAQQYAVDSADIVVNPLQSEGR